jgi:hypothetical protein
MLMCRCLRFSKDVQLHATTTLIPMYHFALHHHPCCCFNAKLLHRYLRCSKDVQFHAKDMAYLLGETNFWNYVYHNGPGSLFTGYMWSLDVFVDYAWAQLGTLNNVLVVLLIVEVCGLGFLG